MELDAAQLPRSLEDVDAAVINTNYALEAGLNPAGDALIREGEKAPYVNVLVVRTADKNADWVKTLVSSYHSPEVKQFIAETFKGSVIPAGNNSSRIPTLKRGEQSPRYLLEPVLKSVKRLIGGVF